MLQLARNAGAKTIAVASSDDKLRFCKEQMGADFTINYKTEGDVAQKVLDYTDGKGANVIADPVGAQNAAQNQKSAALDCRWILYGFLGGSVCQNFDMGPLLRKRIQLIATTLKSRSN